MFNKQMKKKHRRNVCQGESRKRRKGACAEDNRRDLKEEKNPQKEFLSQVSSREEIFSRVQTPDKI